MGPEHQYSVELRWTDTGGAGTAAYNSYSRDHVVGAAGVPTIEGSADRAFRGDATRWNPELLLLAAVSQCHMLSYLHQAVLNDVVVVNYTDKATGVMTEDGAGGGRFTEIVLHPTVMISAASDTGVAERIHVAANRACFIANSLNLPVRHEVHTVVAS